MLTLITCTVYLIVGISGLIELDRQSKAYEAKQKRLNKRR